MNTKTGNNMARQIGMKVLIGVFAFICAFPFYIILISSFTSESTIITEGYSLLPRDFSVEAYRLCFKNPAQIIQAYWMTISTTVVGTLIAVFLGTMTGYVLQRRDFRWGNQFSFFFFFTMLFNGGLTPTYIWCTKYLGFKNSVLALVLPLAFNVWYTIIAKNYFKDIPYELVESAKMDGANDLMIYLRIMLPVAKPLLATLIMFNALRYWNDWYNCMLYISENSLRTMQYFLQNMLNSIKALKEIAQSSGEMMQQQTLPQETMKMAMTVIATGPILLVYPFLQKYFVKGLTVGAVKG